MNMTRERVEFELWMQKEHHAEPGSFMLERYVTGAYCRDATQDKWQGWTARAALQPST